MRFTDMETKIRQIICLLSGVYSRPVWRSSGDPLSVLVQTILSQNTADTNSKQAFDCLVSVFPRWEEVMAADVRDISAAIKAGGLANIKAARIKRVLEMIRQERGSLNLDFLSTMPLDEAGKWLKKLPGVGEKTAACVLLFSLCRPALPVDTHVHRLARRLALIGKKTSAERAHFELQRMVPQECVFEFHVLLIAHGRRICKARNPKCMACVLKTVCPSCGKQQTRPFTKTEPV